MAQCPLNTPLLQVAACRRGIRGLTPKIQEAKVGKFIILVGLNPPSLLIYEIEDYNSGITQINSLYNGVSGKRPEQFVLQTA